MILARRLTIQKAIDYMFKTSFQHRTYDGLDLLTPGQSVWVFFHKQWREAIFLDLHWDHSTPLVLVSDVKTGNVLTGPAIFLNVGEQKPTHDPVIVSTNFTGKKES